MTEAKLSRPETTLTEEGLARVAYRVLNLLKLTVATMIFGSGGVTFGVLLSEALAMELWGSVISLIALTFLAFLALGKTIAKLMRTWSNLKKYAFGKEDAMKEETGS